MATFLASSTVTSSAGNLLSTAISSTAARTITVNKDAVLQTLYISGSSTEQVYKSTDAAGRVAETCYVYIAASPSNAAACDVLYVTGSVTVNSGKLPIARLKAGEWIFLPYTTLVNHPESASLQIQNLSTVSASYVTVLFAESGSL